MTALLSCPVELQRRRALLADAPHLARLQPFLADLRRRRGEVPDPDPLDGGAEARLLVLLETPGPRIRASGIVSRDNPSGTGRNLRVFLDEAGIARRDTLIWNAVPWIIHAEGAANRAPSRAELAAGLEEIRPLLACLPNLAVVILAGRMAAAAESAIVAAKPGLPVLRMHHPSPTIQCTSPDIGRHCRAAMAQASRILAAARPGDQPWHRGEGAPVLVLGS